MKRRAFTLIELLVVIAIIAILAAILFPVFSRVRLKAQQSNCLSNLKQIALAVRMYASDYGGMLPYCPTPLPGDTWYDPTASLGPYLGEKGAKSGQVWVCPSAPTTTTPGGSYIKNGWAGTYDGWNGWILSAIPAPTDLIMFGDGWGGGNTGVCMRMDSTNFNSTTPDTGLTADPPYWPVSKNQKNAWWMSFGGWHSGKCDFNFMDGHAKTMDLATVAHTTYVSKQYGTVYTYLSCNR